MNKTISKYIPSEVEPKWRKVWEKERLYRTKHGVELNKYYVLDMFPYPSGDGLHVGHFKGYTATDIISRYLRAKNFNVLHPMGWDAFGLPAENYAIKTGINPAVSTAKNIAHIKEQMQMVGLSYDWDREINTTDPAYYKWTQWIFLQLYKKGLAYQAEAPINWCPKDKTGLANEEVVDGKCDRCGTPVVRKKIRQWILKITAYADRLISGLDQLDWPMSIKEMQKNWIGRSEGARIKFEMVSFPDEKRNPKSEIEVFTTRADTLFGATYMVLAPEHELVSKITAKERKKDVDSYAKSASGKTDLERTALEKIKTGVFTGAYAINPVNSEKIPIWIADYVLESYGTGAIMAVPAHDERDFEFAKKYKLAIKTVIRARGPATHRDQPFTQYGALVSSGKYDGLTSEEAKKKIIDDLKKDGKADFTVSYKLRDWIFSRQRYWGEPIPIVHCQKCGTVPLDEKDLPLVLPKVEKYQPTGTGESPLAAVSEWVNTTCPNCAGHAKRETNTMPQWAGSCWYYLRFIDPDNDKKLVDAKLEKYWMGKNPKIGSEGGVDWYVGGAEHAVLHLLYARFWHKFLFDIGVASTEEPFFKLRNVGLILGPDGQKMSKSRGNIISPEEMVNSYGADTLRMFEMFVGPFGDVADWNPRAVEGVYRFIQRIWLFANQIIESGRKESDSELIRLVNNLVGKVEADILEMKFNTSVAAMMEFINAMSKDLEKAGVDVLLKFLLVLAPFAPFVAEELWQMLQNQKLNIKNQNFKSVHQEEWPEYDPEVSRAKMVTLVVQVNGRVRDKLLIEAGIGEEEAKKLALASAKVQKFVGNKSPQKVIYVKDRLINIVA